MLVCRQMKQLQLYLNNLNSRLNKNFDIRENYQFKKWRYDLYAEMNVRNEKFLLLQEVKIYGFENNEFFFIRNVCKITREDLKAELDELKSSLRDISAPRKDHMSSSVSLVLITESEIPGEVEKFARRYFHQKSFAFGFKGWADLTVIVVSLPDGRVISNKKMKKTAAFFKPDASVSQED